MKLTKVSLATIVIVDLGKCCPSTQQPASFPAVSVAIAARSVDLHLANTTLREVQKGYHITPTRCAAILKKYNFLENLEHDTELCAQSLNQNGVQAVSTERRGSATFAPPPSLGKDSKKRNKGFQKSCSLSMGTGAVPSSLVAAMMVFTEGVTLCCGGKKVSARTPSRAALRSGMLRGRP